MISAENDSLSFESGMGVTSTEDVEEEEEEEGGAARGAAAGAFGYIKTFDIFAVAKLGSCVFLLA
jgi:hypothetical protein